MNDLILECGSGSARSLPLHRNRGLELVSLVRGRLFWQVEGVTWVVKPGSLFFTLPWELHGSLLAFEPGHYWDFVVLRLETADPMKPGEIVLPPALGFSPQESARIGSLLRHRRAPTLPGTPALAATLAQLVHECRTPGPYAPRRIAALATLALTGLAEALETGPGDRPETLTAHRIARVIDRLRADPARPWPLAEMAALAGLRKSRFIECFSRETGDTPVQFLHRLRIEEARRLLRETGWEITRVAHECGYGTSQYFARMFRRLTGVSASAFRAGK